MKKYDDLRLKKNTWTSISIEMALLKFKSGAPLD